MLEFPAQVFVRFFANHNLLSLTGQPQWMTVVDGSRSYVDKLSAPFSDRIRRSCAVRTVARDNGGVKVEDCDGNVERFDEVVFACHPDETLAMLTDVSDSEREALGAIVYQRNVTVLHRDPSFMPKRRVCWASWIYQSDRQEDTGNRSVTYWMNSLQGIDKRNPVFVTLNPYRPILPELVFDEHVFMHPVFDFAALKAQDTLKSMQGQRNTWFCGAYLGHGFHEDGLVSAMRVAEALGVPPPWSSAVAVGVRSSHAPRKSPLRLIEDGLPAALG
jgi:predicted NAD/FAD-binding protein